MPKSRDRHGRGVRGPLAMPNPLTGRAVSVPSRLSDRDFFVSSVAASISTVQARCPRALLGVDVGVQEVPDQLIAGGAQHFLDEAVPLAMAVDGEAGRPARVVLFRRPLQRRASERSELRDLVHATLVEQLAALTGIAMHEIDPDIDLD